MSKNLKLKELVIETTDLPPDLFTMTLNPEWIKFKYLTIKTLKDFDKIKTQSLAFDKCKFDTNLLDEVNKVNPNLKKLQITSCDMTGVLNVSQFKNLEELQLVYTLESINELNSIIEGSTIKNLLISGDLIRSKEDKKFINTLKNKGIIVKTIGPVI